jgi:ubiquinone/menaquinone biosynthesis C-methylase UbiE
MFMSLRRHRRAWEDLGRVDPLWAVLSSSTRRHGRWDPAEFFATGDADIAALMKSAEELGLPRDRKVVLDFGCGVGRLARALASRFDQYIGVDISDPMVAQAREWNRDCTNCRFILNTSGDLRIFESASVDLVYTKYVLQHLPSKSLVHSYLREFVRLLRPGGLLAFQLPSRIGLLHRIQPRQRVYTLLRSLGISERLLLGPLGLTPMQMRSMSGAEVTKFITNLGARVVRVEHLSKLNQVYFVTP